MFPFSSLTQNIVCYFRLKWSDFWNSVSTNFKILGSLSHLNIAPLAYSFCWTFSPDFSFSSSFSFSFSLFPLIWALSASFGQFSLKMSCTRLCNLASRTVVGNSLGVRVGLYGGGWIISLFLMYLRLLRRTFRDVM